MRAMSQRARRGHDEESDGCCRGEPDEQWIDVSEKQAEEEHRAEVGDEAGGEDELADLLPGQARLDHDRIHDRDRGGR
jgi:hypothetical protein